MRTITEILIESDTAETSQHLSGLWEEIKSNLKKYSLVELEFAQEHLEAHARKMAKIDIKKYMLCQ